MADSLEAAPPAVPTFMLDRDTVVASPGVLYPAGALHRFLFGDLNRELWGIEFEVPVLDLDEVGGGLEFEELGGGLQTLGIRFASRDGRTFQYRSIVKNAARAIPEPLQFSPVEDVVQDQMAALFPLSAMVVAELVESAGVLVAKPIPVVMPDDPRLGDYRETFAGRMGWIEERPNEAEGDAPGFAGSSKITGTDELFEELSENPRSYVNQRDLLRARLIDLMVNDWDRHEDQWRWASFEENGRIRWDPIPRDRDWALAHLDGVMVNFATNYYPKYVGFSDDDPDVFALTWSAQNIDRRLMTELDREDYLEVARELQVRLDDGALARAVGVLPGPYRDAVGAPLLANLTSRRDRLVETATELYEHLAKWVNVFATGEADSVVVTPGTDGSVRVQVLSLREDGLVTYDRTLLPAETKEVRVYLCGGDDRFVLSGESVPGLRIRVVGDDGDDRFFTDGRGDRVYVYDHEDDNDFDLGPETKVYTFDGAGQEEPPLPFLMFDRRDWGSAWIPMPMLSYDPDQKWFVGLGYQRYGFGFARDPYSSLLTFSVQNGFAPDRWIGKLGYEELVGQRGWRAGFDVYATTEFPQWFFGLGNETPVLPPDSARSFRNWIRTDLQVRFDSNGPFSAYAGPSVTVAGSVDPGAFAFDQAGLYGTDRFDQIGARGGVAVDTRDDLRFPSSGILFSVDGKYFPEALDIVEPFGGVAAEARAYASAGPIGLHLRAGGENIWGTAPYAERAFLGGAPSLVGYRDRRYTGDRSASAAGLLRLDLFRTHVIWDMDVGVHGIGSIGRVWLDGEESDEWHPGYGGGVWFHMVNLEQTVTASYVLARDGDGQFYFSLGFPF